MHLKFKQSVKLTILSYFVSDIQTFVDLPLLKVNYSSKTVAIDDYPSAKYVKILDVLIT